MTNPARDALENLGETSDENVRELARHYQTMFQDPLVLEDLRQKFFFYDTTLDERFTESREGSRAVILYIGKMLAMDVSKSIETETEGGD